MAKQDIKDLLSRLTTTAVPRKTCIHCGHQFQPGERLIIRAHVSTYLRPGAVILREVCLPCHRGNLN